MNSKTKYPIILIHGMGVRDRKLINSWGRIPKKLSLAGCKVFQGGQDSNGSIPDNALVIKKRILEVLQATGAEKVNIIAHSKGGLDVRYMISSLDMGDKVASLTTVSTPHHGSKTIDTLLKFPAPLIRFGCAVTDLIMRVGGDSAPKTYEVIKSFSTDEASSFNKNNPNDVRVLYQSYAFYMKHWYSDIFMSLPYIVVYLFEGQNDGLVVPSAAMWGSFKGICGGNSRRGISHCDVVDMRRFRLTKKKGDQISDIVDFYLGVANELQKNGF